MKKFTLYILIIAVLIVALKHYGVGFLASFAALAFMIFFHELGHFLAARACGVAVRRFSVGFGQVVAAKRYGRTIYQISAIPLGGYVKMKGQQDLPKKHANGDFAVRHTAGSELAQQIPRSASYEEISRAKKILILLAGPVANLLLGWLIFVALAFAPVHDAAPIVAASSNAALKIGDEILAINGAAVRGFSEISPHVRAQNELQIRRDGQLLQISASAQEISEPDLLGQSAKRYVIGIQAGDSKVVYKRNFAEAFSAANSRTYEISTLILRSLGLLISGKISADHVGGIIAINDVASTAAQTSALLFAGIVAMISINLGIMNLLPIPVLDGGHIVILLLGAVFGERAAVWLQKYGAYVGLAALCALMCLATYNDFMNYIF